MLTALKSEASRELQTGLTQHDMASFACQYTHTDHVIFYVLQIAPRQD